MNRRSLLACLGAGFSITTAGCAGFGSENERDTITVTRTVAVTRESTPTPRVIEKTVEVTPESTPTPQVRTKTVYKTRSPTPTPTNTPSPTARTAQTFSGSGDSLIQELQVDGGVVLVEATHDSAEPFSVVLVPESDGKEYVIANSDGDGGEYAHLLDAGSYLIEVGAGGDWSVEFVQPNPSSGQTPPISISGTGNVVTGPYDLDGKYISDGKYNRQGDFVVKAYPLSGFFPTDVIRATDGVDSPQAFNFSGLCFFQSDVDGEWSLTVSEG